MKFICIFSFLSLCIVIAVLLCSCNYAEIIDIVHRDTSALPTSSMFSDTALTHYRLEGVVFVPRVTHLDHKTSRLDLIVYAAHLVEDIFVESAVLCGPDGHVLMEMDLVKKVSISIDTVNQGMFVGGIVLMDSINNASLLPPSSNSTINLHLSVRVGDSKMELSYELEPKNRTYIIQR